MLYQGEQCGGHAEPELAHDADDGLILLQRCVCCGHRFAEAVIDRHHAESATVACTAAA